MKVFPFENNKKIRLTDSIKIAKGCGKSEEFSST
jgi:hypothetical protein